MGSVWVSAWGYREKEHEALYSSQLERPWLRLEKKPRLPSQLTTREAWVLRSSNLKSVVQVPIASHRSMGLEIF
ncbi:hypothetical protein QYF36_021997 [Acer negundo]|nr:hypothetical protein QYF36_021997 [Acer negundo]